MNDTAPASVIHYYDTHAHSIACGVRGGDHRSTKHPRSVTCHACVGILRERPARDESAVGHAATGHAAPA